MASLCTRCALRASRTPTSTLPIRSFTTTPSASAHAVPAFNPTESEELNDVLATMRQKHLIPAALSKPQQRLIFGTKHREEMTKNPQRIELAGEEVELQWMDRRTEIPNRTKLFKQAVKLMVEDGSKEAWSNLPRLLVGLRRSRVEVERKDMEQILRLAINSGHFGIVLSCLRRGEETGILLTRPEVFEAVLLALRRQARVDDWSEESIKTAIREGRQVAEMLEMEMHGGGKTLRAEDLRQDPRIIGLFLELSAQFAQGYQDGKDVDGRVKAYAERLLANAERAQIVDIVPAKAGPQTAILLNLPILHGLTLAQEILGRDWPGHAQASSLVNYHRERLGNLVEQLWQVVKPTHKKPRALRRMEKRAKWRAGMGKPAKEEKNMERDSYAEQALQAWDEAHGVAPNARWEIALLNARAARDAALLAARRNAALLRTVWHMWGP